MQQGMSYGQNATNPNAVQAYMNPYLQATLAPSLQLLNQQYGQQNVANQAQATQQGAFGGGRSAVMQGLNQQNQDLATNQLVSNAYNQAYNTANTNMQQAASLGMQGAGLGIQGAQAGLSGVGAQQAGYAGLGSQATNLGNLAGAQTQTGLNINAAQQQAGALQQQNQQNILNQAMANYNTAQTYPMTQLAQLESLYTGAPQNITSSTYSAAPSTVSQLAGLAGTAVAGAKLAGAKKGGSVKDIKKMAAGGIAAYDVGGAIGSVEASLENMDAAELEDTIKTSTSPFIREKAKELLPMAIQRGAGVTGAGAGQTNFAAGGGIVAFASGDLVGDTQDQEDLEGGVGSNTQLPVAAAPIGPVSPALKSGMSWLDQLKALGYGQPTQDDLDLRTQLKQDRADAIKDREKNKWLALLEGSGAALSSTSPFAGPGIGNMVSTGAKSYAAGEKDYADQLAKLRSGELDLNKLNASDKNNLLHYALTGATSEQNAALRTQEMLEAAKLRQSQVGSANADRAQNKLLSIASQFYTADLKAAQDKLGIDKVTEDMKQTIYNNAMRRASQVPNMLKQGAKGSSDVGAKDAGSDPLDIRG
jgi:hypothetical protein